MSNVLVGFRNLQLQYCLAEAEHTQRCSETSTLWVSVTLSWKPGEPSDALVSSFPLLVEHVPTVVNLSMYHALVGTVWATIRTGASIHHGPVTYSTLSEETKWSFGRNVNNPQWTISGAIWTVQLESRAQTEFRVQAPIDIQELLCSHWGSPMCPLIVQTHSDTAYELT